MITWHAILRNDTIDTIRYTFKEIYKTRQRATAKLFIGSAKSNFAKKLILACGTKLSENLRSLVRYAKDKIIWFGALLDNGNGMSDHEIHNINNDRTNVIEESLQSIKLNNLQCM